MIPTILATILLAISTTQTVAQDFVLGAQTSLAERSFSLKNRYPVESVNDVFRDNILLTLSYMDGKVETRGQIDWAKVNEKQTYSFTLNPGELFAFHEDVYAKYDGKVTKTTNAHFNGSDGFKSDGYLMGDGVCHVASLIYWAAKDAGLDAVSPTNHDFANIPDVPREYGVSIYLTPDSSARSEPQNLYITNNREKPVTFLFDYNGETLTVNVTE